MNWWDSLSQNAQNTPVISNLQDAFQQYGYNRQQGVPLGRGGTGNSVYQALTTGQVGKAQAAELPTSSPGGGGGGGAGGDDGWVDPNANNNSPAPQQGPAPANLKDPNANPGEGWWWDAADGWKRSGGGDSGPSYEDQQRSEINRGFDEYFRGLDAQIGLTDQQGGNLTNQIGTLFNEQQGQLQNAQNTQLGALEKDKTEAVTNKSNTLKELSDDFRNALQAGQVYLGSIGAGSSSAVGRMSGALSKAANKRTTDVARQSTQIMADIDERMAGVRSTTENELSNLRQWKASKVSEIANWVATQKQAIEQARANGQLQKSGALQDLNTQVHQMAMQELQNIQNQATSFNNAITEWALSRAENLNQARQNLAELGSYQVPGYQVDQFSGEYTQAPTTSKTWYGGANTEEEKKPLFSGRY